MFYIQTVSNKWEEVTEFVFKNHKYVVNDNGERRYGEKRFSVQNGQIHLTSGDFTKDEIGMIARISGATIPSGSVMGGFAPKPTELLLIRRGSGSVHHHVGTNRTFKLIA